MKKENEYSLEKLEKACSQLEDGIKNARDQLGRDGVIQRFEFTFELLWKALKISLREKGVEARTPKDALKEAFSLEWINKESPYLNMLEDRNKTSHMYDKKTVDEIFNRVAKDYLPAIKEVLKKLKEIS